MENLQNKYSVDENVVTWDHAAVAEKTLKPTNGESTGKVAGYLLAGILFGIILVKGEIISWYRIQEMFLLDSFHMYGIIGSAVFVAAIGIQIIKSTKTKTFDGQPIIFYKKIFSWGQIIGGTMFGLGWALTGACPGPLYAQFGSGFMAAGVSLFFAIAGTWFYGLLRDKLPH
ncbi:MAG: YeeE/YedE family protein [Bacteroidia bacterium]|nr:YeeE/YedE family protein [Bacteroidia bacterium]